MFVPVKSKSGKQLMPTHPNKAGVLIKKGIATPGRMVSFVYG